MTDVHFQPQAEAVRGIPVQNQSLEQLEMAAFEKGRMQGELEAARRMEAEQGQQLKTFDQAPVAQIQRPDIIEINRLTVPQKIAGWLGEGCALTYVGLTVAWINYWRGDVGWTNERYGDNIGDTHMYNTGLLCQALGLWFLTQAIVFYRLAPINMNPLLNKAAYIFNYSAAITCFIIALVAQINSPPEMTFWAVDNWCYVAALAVVVFHGLYSMARVLVPYRPVDYETWSETDNKLTLESPEQMRDHSTHNAAGRTLYTPAPVYVPRQASYVPAASANVGAEVPVAPANAPRWAENPNTHAEDYFLLPRAKWAVCGFVGIGATFLMTIAATEHIQAAGHSTWSQDGNVGGSNFNENGQEARLVGVLGLFVLMSILMIAYAAMPPRTTLVKNGILQDANRRTSISHNAETRLGPNMV